MRACLGYAIMTAGALLASGCAYSPSTARAGASVDSVIADRVLASAAAQVRRCYRSPRVASAGKQIVTRLAVRLNPDGTLAGLPALVSQSGLTPFNRPYAGRMAEAATLAVIRCAPLRLPPDLYPMVWERFDLNFSPTGSA
jgi:hypothetical protein